MEQKYVLFFDTNALLNLGEKVFKDRFFISQKSLQEIESIKLSSKKDDTTKYLARKISNLLSIRSDDYDVIPTTTSIKNIAIEFDLDESPDNIILAAAYFVNKETPIKVITNDTNMQFIAKKIFKLECDSIESIDKNKEYKGYKDIILSSDEEMADFYSNMNCNKFNLLENEYAIIKDKDNNVLEVRKWCNENHVEVVPKSYKSDYFGSIKPYSKNGKPDIYQSMALDSFSHNKITMIKGHAGTGKSYLAIGYLFHLLEKDDINKIIIFCNTVATANSAKLGFYPGTKDEKLIDSSIGNMLTAKFGSKFILEELISKEKIALLPMSDIRGFDTGDKECGVYITEAQNMDISLMKLALQRIGDKAVTTIIDGDYTTQVDSKEYSGINNGMRRMSEVFRGHTVYGEIELQEIYRSEIAKIADKM